MKTIKYFIVLAFHPHGNVVSGVLKRYFLRTGPRVERSGNAASAPWRRGNRYFLETMTSSPRRHGHVTRRKPPVCCGFSVCKGTFCTRAEDEGLILQFWCVRSAQSVSVYSATCRCGVCITSFSQRCRCRVYANI